MLLVRFIPATLLSVVFANLLLVPLALASAGAVPRCADSLLECAAVLVVALLFGPFAALGGYLLLALIRQECSGAIVALLAVNILIKELFAVAFAPVADTTALAAMWGFLNWPSFFGVCLSFAGCLLPSFSTPAESARR